MSYASVNHAVQSEKTVDGNRPTCWLDVLLQAVVGTVLSSLSACCVSLVAPPPLAPSRIAQTPACVPLT